MRRPPRTLVAAGLLAAALAALLVAWFASGWADVRAREREVRAAPSRAAAAKGAELARQVRGELDALLAREIERPYFHYQNLFHDPRGTDTLAVAPSPLAGPREDELVLGYFQLDARGAATTPTVNEDVPELSEPTRLADNVKFRDEVARDLTSLAPKAEAVGPLVADARPLEARDAVRDAPRAAAPVAVVRAPVVANAPAVAPIEVPRGSIAERAVGRQERAENAPVPNVPPPVENVAANEQMQQQAPMQQAQKPTQLVQIDNSSYEQNSMSNQVFLEQRMRKGSRKGGSSAVENALKSAPRQAVTSAPLSSPHASTSSVANPPAMNPPATNPHIAATSPVAASARATDPRVPATSSAANPPATNPPATNPPATNPPATNPPATNPPATNPPAAATSQAATSSAANPSTSTNPRTAAASPATANPRITATSTSAANPPLAAASSAANPAIPSKPPASSPRPRATPKPPKAPAEALVTITVAPLEWRTLPFAGAPALVAVRAVHTPNGALSQGFVIDPAALRAQVAERAGHVGELEADVRVHPATAAPADAAPEPEAALAATEIAPGWDVIVRAKPAALAAAADDASAIGRAFAIRFVLVGLVAALAAAAVVLLVARAERLARERSQFAAAAAHELRTPLAGLQLYGDMLADGLGDPAKLRDYARRMSEEAARLGRVVSNVLGFSQLERGNLSVEARPGDLAAALRDLAERAEPALDRAGAALLFDAAPGLAARFDRDALARIVGNLLDNAEKYSRGADDRTISLVAARTADAVEIAVSDHGPGITAQARARLFRPFSRGVSTDGPAGLGLGLALSRSLAAAMGGSLDYRASPSGAVFVLRLATV